MDQNETANLVAEQPFADHQTAAIPASSAKKVAIFTNSVSDISPALAEEFGIHIVPDIILFDTEEYRNNIDIDPPALYQKLTACEKLPTTSHPNPSIYTECFRQAADASDIICINLTSKMSGSINSASDAKMDLLRAFISMTLCKFRLGLQLWSYRQLKWQTKACPQKQFWLVLIFCASIWAFIL